MYPSVQITFLGSGTSSGVPMIGCKCKVCTSLDKKDKRLRSSILVKSPTTTIVVDTTPDFRYQMIREGVDKLDAVIFTHPHKDHIAGLDDIRAFNFFMQRPIDVYANELTQKAIRKEFSYAFEDKQYPGLPQMKLHTIKNEEFVIGDISIIPIKVYHLHMEVLGFRFGRYTYITDANRIDETERKKIEGTEVITLNALRMEQHLSHFSLPEAEQLVKELGIPTAYFTHMSHQIGLHEEVSSTIAKGMHLAYDGLKIDF